MSDYIKKKFNKHFDIEITNSIINSLLQYVIQFEIRDEHPLVLNTPLLGINKIYFSTPDQEFLFDTLDVTRFDVVNVISDIPSINKEFVVTSNPYNLLIIYVIHQIYSGNHKKKYEISIALLKILQYKFFSSILNHFYPYTANEEVMRYTIENLSEKYDIIKYGTWRNVIISRSEAVLDKHGIHYNTLIKFNDDDKILYLISDIQTRIRNQIKNISSVFYQNKEMNNVVKNYSPTQNIDGLKLIKDIQGHTEVIKHKLNSQIINKNTFINDNYIILLNSIFKLVNKLTIRRFLEYMCDSAQEQRNMKNLQVIINKKDFKFYNCITTLSYETIKGVYLYCYNNNINIKKKLSLLQTTKQLFISSRLQNDRIRNVKFSLNIHITNCKISNKKSVKSTLTNIFAMYLILKSFEYMGT